MNFSDHSMTSSKPYLLQALLDWIVDNDCTPHIVVDADCDNVDVPRQFVRNGQITLNIAPRAVQQFLINAEAVSFETRFGGVASSVYAPIDAIRGIYARENKKGMMFEKRSDSSDSPNDAGPVPVTTSSPASPTPTLVAAARPAVVDSASLGAERSPEHGPEHSPVRRTELESAAESTADTGSADGAQDDSAATTPASSSPSGSNSSPSSKGAKLRLVK